MYDIQNVDFKGACFEKKAGLVVLDPPHDVYFEDLFEHIDNNSKANSVKLILDSEKNLLKYIQQNENRFSFFMVHDFILHMHSSGNRPFRQFDLIAVFDFNVSRFNVLNDGFSDVIRIFTERGKGNANLIHPHQKPVKLYIELINHFSFEGDIVMDFFAGSGNIVKACKATGRNFQGTEIDKQTFENMQTDWDSKKDKQLKINF